MSTTMPTPLRPEPKHTVSFLREVLARLSLQQLVPTPENFAWTYRELQREQKLPVAEHYENDLDALHHAVNAFDQLFVADAWLNAKLEELREVLTSNSISTPVKRQQVKGQLEAIAERKEDLLFHLAESSLSLKAAIADVVREVGKLSSVVGGFQLNLGRYQDLVDNCHDISDARRVMTMVAAETKRLNESLCEHESSVAKNFSTLRESGSAILDSLVQHERVIPTISARNNALNARHAVATAVIDADTLLARVRGADFEDGVLLVVQLADPKSSPDTIRRFSELLATKLDRAMLLGYLGGTQFIFVMPNAGAARALIMAREIAREVEREVEREGQREVQRHVRNSPSVKLNFEYGTAGYSDNDHSAVVFHNAFELALGNLRPMRDALAT